TPNVKTINDLAKFFNCDADHFLKSIIYVADDKPVMAVVPGSREINETKLKKALGCNNLELATDTVVTEVTKAPVGFAGPVNNFKIRTICDIAVKDIINGITGANQKDVHLKGVNPGRDFEIKEEGDITSAIEGDQCIVCGKQMYTKKGLEVGHIFKLGYKYTKTMNVSVLDDQGKAVTPIMGCYGIGITRTLAAVIEQHHDEKGLQWPVSVAPFSVHLVGIAKTDEEKDSVEAIYKLIQSCGIDVLYDDRNLSPGIKFADADLIGLPIRITVGKGYFTTGELEIKFRSNGEMIKVQKEDLVKTIKKYIESENATLRFDVF
ncbi:MAG TPA: YbaK/EbsC family protein, partial [Spirochaetota bacterium]